MNTRLQVEHPVTELVTGLDLVEWQLRIASGERLSFRQEDVTWTGSAIECRIYAEDPENQFLPYPGLITYLREPSGPGLRLDSGVYAGWTVPLDYDPLLAKLAAWAPTRGRAIERLTRALAEYSVGGIRTNTAFFRDVLADPIFQKGQLSTAFLEGFFARRSEPHPSRDSHGAEAEAAAALVAALEQSKRTANPPQKSSRWVSAGRKENFR
jgi:acetyl-CoA carboxylase biotin carboxylase subunit